MQITIINTSKIVHLNAVPARVWEGETDSGIQVICFVTRIMVASDKDISQFERELKEVRPPSVESEAIPLRLVL